MQYSEKNVDPKRDKCGTIPGIGDFSTLSQGQNDGPAGFNTNGTTRSFTKWTREIHGRSQVLKLKSEVMRLVESRTVHSESHFLNRSAAVLNNCGRWHVANKLGDQWDHVHSFNCKKKYCPRCHGKKQSKMVQRFTEFFESTESGKNLLATHDVAILTLTLRHNQNTRQGWYFKELQKHFANLLKYGTFKKYLAGGIYNTEVTHSKTNGFHIHRHAVVFVPKCHQFKDGVVGSWFQDDKGKWKFVWTDRQIMNEIKSAWMKKTGDSFMVDIKPINPNTGLIKNILEVFKYTGKPYKDSKGNKVMPAEVVEQLEKNSREKFHNKFGIVYKIKDLNINFSKEEPPQNENQEPQNLYLVQMPWTRSGRVYFHEIEPIGQMDMKELIGRFRTRVESDIQRDRSNYESDSFHRQYRKTDFVRSTNSLNSPNVRRGHPQKVPVGSPTESELLHEMPFFLPY